MSVTPSDAATVILMRPCPQSRDNHLEILLVLRNRKSRFVPGYSVFPGGSIDPEDYVPGIENHLSGLGRSDASRILSDMSHPDKALGAWVAAIRETFEETGVLLAERQDGAPLDFQGEPEKQRFASYRKALLDQEITFPRILEKEKLVLPLDRLRYWSHWITPEPFPLRYDVRFFAAEAPPEQTVAHDGVELTGHLWISPSEALRRYEQGRLDMVLPQIITLQELAPLGSVADVMEAAGKRNVGATLTKISQIDGRDVEVMPDGSVFENRPPVYPQPDEK